MKLLLSTLTIVSITLASAQVKFENSLQEAFAKAKKSNKLVFIEYYDSTCGICKSIQPIFNDKEVSDFYNTNFVNYRINIHLESSKEDEKYILNKNLHIEAVPKFLFFDKDENFMHYSGISANKKSFIDVGKDALNPSKQTSKLEHYYNSGDRSITLLYNYSQYAALRKDKALQNKIADDLFMAIPPSELNKIYSYYILKNSVFTTKNKLFIHWINNIDQLKDFETGYKSGKEKEQLHRIIENDLNNKNIEWTSDDLKDLRHYMEVTNYSTNIDLLLWEKELKAFINENDTHQIRQLLYNITEKTINESETLIYILNQFKLIEKQEIQFETQERINQIITKKQDNLNDENKIFISKLKKLQSQ